VHGRSEDYSTGSVQALARRRHEPWTRQRRTMAPIPWVRGLLEYVRARWVFI